MSENPKNSKVRASRDGDQFHYLWAARECLALIAPTASLVAIAIEGAATFETDQTGLEAGDEMIDVAKYYGDQDFIHAKRVVYSQLKHSTLRKNQPWTWSGVEKTVAGFGQKFREIAALSGGAVLVRKVEFSFISNRPVSAALCTTFAQLASGSRVDDDALRLKLEQTTGLAGAELRSFCSQFRIDAGQPDYWDQRHLLAQDLHGYLPGLDVDAPLQLKDLITRKALSESSDNNVVTRIDVLRVLKTDVDAMFPAPCRIESPDNMVPREQTADLVGEIVSAGAVPFIVHAEGGVGKSIFTLSIGDALPPGSVTVLYDCFGNGEYRSVSGYRHRHRDATVQIANELSSKRLCHPLLQGPHAEASDYIKALLYRLKQASEIVQARTPGAILAIVIDAADNAQMAAEEFGEARSFVLDLIRAPIPGGVRIIYLCRTHRQSMLMPPVTTVVRELKPFSLDETRALLLKSFPAATDINVSEFHRLSSHNPRVQALALAQGGTLPEILIGLGPNPTTVESTLASLLGKSVAKLRDEAGNVGKSQVDRICAGLATLRPLIPISVLSSLSGAPEAAIRSFAFDLGRPLFVNGDLIHFLDEPSETWFRETFKPKPAAMAKFVASLKPLATRSPYVAAVLPQLMLEAGQLTQLVALALSSDSLPGENPIEKRDVELQRLQFALKASLRARRWADASKLSLKAGGETAGDDRQNGLIEANTDLAARFLSTDRVQELVSRRVFSASWLGSHNCYEAGLMSFHPTLGVEVRSRLRMAEEWLHNLFTLPEEERRNERVEDVDIAELAMAILNLSGPAACARFLSSWKPKDVAFRVGRLLASRLIDLGRLQDLQSLAAVSSNICLLLAINDELVTISQSCSPIILRKLIRVLKLDKVKLERQGFDHEESALTVVSNLVGAAFRAGVCDKAGLLSLLKRYLPDKPPLGLSSRWASNRTPYMRGRCLQAALEATPLVLTDFADAKLKTVLGESYRQSSGDARDFKETVGRLLPWYQLQAECDAGTVPPEVLQDRIAAARTASAKSEHYYGDHDVATDDIAMLWMKILGANAALTAEALTAFEAWRTALKRPLFVPTLTRLARYLARVQPANPLILVYAAEAYQATKDVREDAESKSRDFVSLARAVLPVSEPEAQGYFDQAVAVASRIGDENIDRWGALLDLADKASARAKPDPEMAYRLSRCAELTYEYVARDKHFAWEDTIAALVNLCPASSLAIFSRWRDRGFGNPHRILARAVETLIVRDKLPAAIVIPLITLPAYWQYTDLLAAGLQDTPASDRQRALDFCWRYLDLDGWEESGLQKLCEAASALGLNTAKIDARIRFQRYKKKSDQRTGRDSSYDGGDPPAHDWEVVFEGLNLIDVTDLATALTRYKSQERSWDSANFFAAVFARAPVGSESQVLTALAQHPDISIYALRNILTAVPPGWKDRVAIKAALAQIVIGVCRLYCLEITRSRHYQTLPLKLACELSGLLEIDLVREVLDALANLPDQFGAGRLFTLNGLLAVMMTPKEAASALSFGLELLEPILEDDDGDGPWKTALAPPNDIWGAFAGYIWAGLSSPRADVRWEAAHAVNAFCIFDNQPLLKALIRFAQSGGEAPFGDARLHFYNLHGLQWLLIGLARGAISEPASLKPHIAFLKSQVHRPDRHVLMRHFASKALLALSEENTIKLPQTSVTELSMVNTPKKPAVVRDRWAHRANPYDKDEDFTFGLDVGPHWFAPLGRVFGLSQGEIGHLVTTVITKDWGIEKLERWDEDQRYVLKIFRDSETSHSHGSPPRSDDFQFYLAYHAMMVVAGALLENEAPTVDRDGWDASFADWLRGYTLTRADGRWVSDRRDPPPLDWPAWKDEKNDEWWRWGIQRADFERVLFPTPDTAVLGGDWTYVASDRTEHLQVSSALVSPATSGALLRTLQTTNAREYHIPGIDDDRETSEEGFELTAWVDSETISKELDELDPWAGEIRYPGLTPVDDVVRRLGLTSDVEKRVWQDAAGRPVIWSEAWTYAVKNERERDKTYEEGRRLTALVESVCRHLADTNKDLIISVRIERSYTHHYGESKDEFVEYPQPYARVFVIGADKIVRSF